MTDRYGVGVLSQAFRDPFDPQLVLDLDIDRGLVVRARVSVERAPGTWAGQALARHGDFDWRLDGPVDWFNAQGELVVVTARMCSRPGIDGQLKRIGGLLSCARSLAENPGLAGTVSELAEALRAVDATSFGVRTTRGRNRDVIAAEHNRLNARRRDNERAGLGAMPPLPLAGGAPDEGWPDAEVHGFLNLPPTERHRQLLEVHGFTAEAIGERDVLDFSRRQVEISKSPPHAPEAH